MNAKEMQNIRKLTITERKQHIKYIYDLVVAKLNEKNSFEKYYEGYNHETFYITKENTILSTSKCWNGFQEHSNFTNIQYNTKYISYDDLDNWSLETCRQWLHTYHICPVKYYQNKKVWNDVKALKQIIKEYEGLK